MSVAIIDYGSGNLRSAAKAFGRAAQATGQAIEVTQDPAILASASHIVLPGVGAYADCMRGLLAVEGLHAALTNAVLEQRTPFLGICVGMQMLFTRGYEHGSHEGLGWIDGEVVKIGVNGLGNGTAEEKNSSVPPFSPSLKIPHMGWNDLTLLQDEHSLLAGIQTGDHAYFVHSYHAVCADKQDCLATTDYGGPLTAVIAKGNIMGTQFHPEKSQAIGLKIIENFLRLS